MGSSAVKARRWTLSQAVAIASVVFAVACYYLWAARAGSNGFRWHTDLPGYYNHLGRAFAAGQLHLHIQPSRELLALSNPWDPKQNEPYRMHDLALFNGRYYLYHGAGPALLLFAPWRLITRHDVPENFAVALLCIGAFLFWSGALLRLLSHCQSIPGPGLLSCFLLALGFCQAAPYLCSRVDMYEVAIAGGNFCLSGAIFFLACGFTSQNSSLSLAASGLLFGLAISCRPHLGIAGAICVVALVVVERTRGSGLSLTWSRISAFLLPFLLCGAAVAAYNYARFGNPLEFGLRYFLAGDTNQQRIRISGANVMPGLYYLLFCPPDVSLVFPWLRLALRLPFGAPGYAFPPEYFLEPVSGAFFTAPFLAGALLRAKRDRVTQLVFAVAFLACFAIVLFIAGTGFTTERYLVDFLPLAVFASVLNFAVYISRRPRSLARAGLIGLFSLLVLASVIANLALGITGPYDELLANKPLRYARIAGWFSPVEQFRPMVNPSIDITVQASFAPMTEGRREPLVTIGRQAFRQTLFVERSGNSLLLRSHSESSDVADKTAALTGNPAKIQLAYGPQTHRLTVAVDDRLVIEQKLAFLVTAPAQVWIGENGLPGFIHEQFNGKIRLISKRIETHQRTDQ